MHAIADQKVTSCTETMLLVLFLFGIKIMQFRNLVNTYYVCILVDFFVEMLTFQLFSTVS